MIITLEDALSKELDYKLLHYGTIITDEDYQRVLTEYGRVAMQNVRTRIIKYGDKLYYHKMVNGELRLIFELK